MDYEKVIDNHFKVLAEKGEGKTIFFQGERGVGKTQLIKDYAKENGMDLYILNLSSIEASDFTGIPRIVEGVTRYAKPEFFDMERGILFLDEVNRVSDSDVKTGLLSLLQDRSINGHKLGKGVLIITAGNTNSDQYDVNDFDLALTDRLVTIPFKRTYKEFLSYMESKNERSDLLDFYKLHKDALKEYSFRTLEYALNYHNVSGDTEALAYYLSPSIYTLFSEFVGKNLYSFDDLIKGKVTKSESSGEKKLILDVTEAFKEGFKFDKTSAGHVNKFLNAIRAENKMIFFEGLKKLAMEDKLFENKKAEWKKVDLFRGLKEYLDKYLS
jgi:hypothetical protein